MTNVPKRHHHSGDGSQLLKAGNLGVRSITRGSLLVEGVVRLYTEGRCDTRRKGNVVPGSGQGQRSTETVK